MKILVAEDDEFLTKIYRMTLEQEGYDVTIAKDGDIAMDCMRKEKPDLVLLDILMPKKDGFDVLKEMKSDTKLKKIPVIVLTNLGQESDAQKAKGLGAIDYIIKGNVEVSDVVEKLKKYK